MTARCSLSAQMTERRTSSATVALPTTTLPRASARRMRSRASQDPMSSQRNVPVTTARRRSEEHTSELQSLRHLVCRLLLEKKKKKDKNIINKHKRIHVRQNSH